VDKKLVHKSVRSGYIDTNKLAEAVQGVPTVYERFGHAKSNKVAVCLVVDESGSMSGSKIDKATTAAILLAEALKKNKEIELFVYGHSADISFHGSVDMRIYKEPGYISEGGMGNIPRNQLSNNADGYAIYEAAKRVRKFTNRPCVMFVMSDGAPAASIYNGMDGGVGHTKKMVDKVTKEENMEVIQIAIEGHVPSEKMFKNYVKFTNLSELPSSLGKLVRKIVSKMIQVTVVNY
jgi:cobalamin biosynthesis protein CobT